MSIYMHEYSRDAMNRAVFIAGNARSGTTILGKILYSMDEVEYAFEPPYLFTLLPLIEELPRDQFVAMFEGYCYEDLLLGAIAGRNINLNTHDDSSAHLAKAEENIAARLGRGWSKNQQVERANRSVLCIKMPDTARPLVSLRKYYPGMKVVATHRLANPVIESILKKGWFSEANLKERTMVWPSQRESGVLIPVWVEAQHVEDWSRWTELERAAYYYITITTGLSKIDGAIAFSYEKLVENPHAQVRALAEKLGLSFGPKTKDILNTVEKKSPRGEDWISKLPKSTQQKIQEAEACRENG